MAPGDRLRGVWPAVGHQRWRRRRGCVPTVFMTVASVLSAHLRRPSKPRRACIDCEPETAGTGP
jgi:hypothetical protein